MSALIANRPFREDLRRFARRSVSGLALVTGLLGLTGVALAQSIATNAPSLAPDTFQSIDANGVDLLSGKLHLKGPGASRGSYPFSEELQLTWNGGMWTFGSPSIWFSGDDDIQIVTPSGTEQFDYNNNQWVNLRGNSSTLVCQLAGTTARLCTAELHDGTSATFDDMSGYALAPINFLLPNGNMMTVLNRSCDDQGICSSSITQPEGKHTFEVSGASGGWEGLYSPTSKILGIVPGTWITVSTPNNNEADRYGRSAMSPDNVTQTMTEWDGSQWSFRFDDQKNLVGVRRPGSASDDLTIEYDSRERVRRLTSADGTWTYAYDSVGELSNTIVTNPDQSTYRVDYIKKRGEVRKVTDEQGRVTTYNYDSLNRISEIILPELNRQTFAYDSRGNVTSATSTPKPNSGDPIVTRQAIYTPTCDNRLNCNRPIAIIDEAGNRTDFTYQDSFVTSETRPAASAGASRPQTNWEYRKVYRRIVTNDGVLLNSGNRTVPVKKSQCMTVSPCAGTADEIITTIDYGPQTGPNVPRIYGMTASWNGQARTTCYIYDDRGNKIAERAPAAGLTGCSQPGPQVPSFSISDASVTEGGTMQMTISMSGNASYKYRLSLRVTGITALSTRYSHSSSTNPDGDFDPPSTSITIAPGETTTTILIPTIDDNNVEGNETFKVEIIDAADGIITDGEAIGTIIDNDQSGGGGGGGGGGPGGGGGGGGEENLAAPTGSSPDSLTPTCPATGCEE